MNETQLGRSDLSGSGWQFFGEFVLPVEQNKGQQIYTWLVETLRPLNLKVDFLEKVLASVQKAAEGGSIVEQGTGQLCIRLYATSASQSPGSTWGFFHTEKKRWPTGK